MIGSRLRVFWSSQIYKELLKREKGHFEAQMSFSVTSWASRGIRIAAFPIYCSEGRSSAPDDFAKPDDSFRESCLLWIRIQVCFLLKCQYRTTRPGRYAEMTTDKLIFPRTGPSLVPRSYSIQQEG